MFTGSVLAIGSNDANIRMYEVETGKVNINYLIFVLFYINASLYRP